MEGKISIIGGDLRIIKLVKLLEKESFVVSTFGLEKSNEIKQNQKNETIEECLKNSRMVISSIPFSKDGIHINAPFANQPIEAEYLFKNLRNVKFIAGSIQKEIIDKSVEVIDILQNETLTIMNAIPSAEGAIQVAMEQSLKTIHGSNSLVMGFGRIGKILSKMLNGIGAKVYCEARKSTDLAWIEAYGFNSINLKDIEDYLPKFDFIFNTIPVMILDKTRLEKVKKDCLIIDLASNPGGVNFEVAKELGIKTNWALGLPRESCTRDCCTIYKK